MDAKRGTGRVYERSGGIFWIQYSLNGVKHRESSGGDRDAAEKMLRNRLKEIGAAQIGARAFTTPQSRRLRVRELVESLRVQFQNNGQDSPQNLCHLRRLDSDFGERVATQLTAAEYDRYIAKRLAAGDKAASINRTGQLLGQCFRLAISTKRLNESDMPKLARLKEQNARTGFVSPTTFEKICAELPEEVLRDLARFAHCCGMRRNEILSLRWDGVSGNTITLAGKNAKNGESRVVPCVSGELADILARRKRARAVTLNGVTQVSPFVFFRVIRERIQPIRHFHKAWTGAARRAGFAGTLFHDLRRTFVHDAVEANVPVPVVMAISGHKTFSMFKRYAITSQSQIADALTAAQQYRDAQREVTSNNVVSMGGR